MEKLKLAAREAAEEIVEGLVPDSLFAVGHVARTAAIIEAAIRRAQGPGWVKASERLPDRGEPCLVRSTTNNRIHVSSLNQYGRWLTVPGQYPDRYVTHWMPLPNPPKED